MANIQQINIGTYANDGSGDDLRVAFQKVNANFSALDTDVISNGSNLGTGSPVFAAKIVDPLIGSSLSFRSIKSGANISVVHNSNEITISTPDSINALVEDTSPSLGGNLNLNNRNITGLGNITITGIINASTVTAAFSGNLTGNVTGNVTGNLTGNVTGNLLGDTTGLHTGGVIGNVSGNLIGDTTGTHTGQVIGNATTVSNGVYTTSSINALADVDTASTPPQSGQALVWSGSVWRPSNVAGGGAGGSLDFGTFTAPAGFTLDMGTF